MDTDVFAVTVVATGPVYAGRTRVRGISYVSGAAAGSIVLRDGGAGGTVLLDLATPASATAQSYIQLPAKGLLFSTNVYATLTGATSLTAFCG